MISTKSVISLLLQSEIIKEKKIINVLSEGLVPSKSKMAKKKKSSEGYRRSTQCDDLVCSLTLLSVSGPAFMTVCC